MEKNTEKSLQNIKNFEKRGELQNIMQMSSRERFEWLLSGIKEVKDAMKISNEELGKLRVDYEKLRQEFNDYKTAMTETKNDNKWIVSILISGIALILTIIKFIN